MPGPARLAFLLSLGLLSCGLHADPAAERGLQIALEADRRDQGWEDSVAELKMILRDGRGQEAERELEIRTLEDNESGDKSLTLFRTPRDVRGTALLTHTWKTQPDDQWLYLPALKRVKRIAAQNQSGPFMGSEFAFEDLASQEVEKFTYRFVEETTCPALPGSCFVIQRTPVSEYSGYSHQVVWLDTAEYRIDQVNYHDRRGELLKTLQNMEFSRHLDQYWRPAESLMTNHQTGRSTLLQTDSLSFRTGLNANDFDPSRLGRGR